MASHPLWFSVLPHDVRNMSTTYIEYAQREEELQTALSDLQREEKNLVEATKEATVSPAVNILTMPIKEVQHKVKMYESQRTRVKLAREDVQDARMRLANNAGRHNLRSRKIVKFVKTGVAKVKKGK